MLGSVAGVEAGTRRRIAVALLAVAAASAVLAACGPSGPPSPSGGGGTSPGSPAAVTAGSLKTATIGGATVLTNAQGFAVYSFAPDTMTKSDCNGACAAAWPPVKGPATDRKSTRLNSSHSQISYAVFCLQTTTNHEIKMSTPWSTLHGVEVTDTATNFSSELTGSAFVPDKQNHVQRNPSSVSS